MSEPAASAPAADENNEHHAFTTKTPRKTAAAYPAGTWSTAITIIIPIAQAELIERDDGVRVDLIALRPNARVNSLPLSSTPMLRAVSMNRSDCLSPTAKLTFFWDLETSNLRAARRDQSANTSQPIIPKLASNISNSKRCS